LPPSPAGITSRFDETGEAIPWELLTPFYTRLRAEYSPEPLDVRTVLFQARHTHNRHLLFMDPSQGWHGIVSGELSIVLIPGDHISMVRRKSHSAILAHHLNKVLL
jgi:thioesterase domain-containing protein